MYRERKSFKTWLERHAYRTHHKSVRASLSRARSAMRLLVNHELVTLDNATKEILRSRYDALLDVDFANAQFGAYPKRFLYETPFPLQPHLFAKFVREVFRQRRRASLNQTVDFEPGIDLQNYPEYFRRNFHWQTNGYLSEGSAELYNMSVEFLFMGMANIMRRQVLPPITRYIRRNKNQRIRVLDVACGTGELLRQMVKTHPEVEFSGIDLSPPYLKTALRRHPELEKVNLLCANAEELPYRDNYFDALTCVYLMHELPSDARRRVFSEMLRVLKPGGLLIVQDSVQKGEVSQMEPLLERYAEEGNEPYFASYLEDDLRTLIEEQGATIVSCGDAFVAKTITARK